MTDLSATFGKPFAEQVAAWRLRLGELRPTQGWTDVEPQFHDRGFMVAGATKAELLADLAAAVDKAIAEGRSLEEFRKDFRTAVAKHGWPGTAGMGTKGGEAWRTRVIYRTNMSTTYAAGRRAQLLEGKFAFWIYRHGGAREPRLHHLALNGIALPPGHIFWVTHSTPNGWGCTCYIVGARSAAGVRRLGGDPDKPLPAGWNVIDPKTGAPRGIDKGWAYAPGATVAETVITLRERLANLPAPIGADMFHGWTPVKTEVLVEDFKGFVAESLTSQVANKMMIVGALKPEWVRQAGVHGLMPETAEIAVRDRDILHTFRPGKIAPLDLGWYQELPRHLQSPRAALLDPGGKHPVLLLVFDVPGQLAKLVVQINYRIKKQGVYNTVETGRLITADDLASTLGRGVVLIDGDL